jgi:hypothetical protein
VVVGPASTVDPVVAVRSVAGLHKYVETPEAINVAVSPKQIVPIVVETLTTLLSTVIDVLEEDVQPFAPVPVTV